MMIGFSAMSASAPRPAYSKKVQPTAPQAAPRFGASPLIVNATDTDFDKEVLQASGPVLVDFWATWCPPCKTLSPRIDNVANQNQGALKVVKVDVDNATATAAKYGVRSIPTLMFFNNGQKLDFTDHTGTVASRITGALDQARLDKVVQGVLAQTASGSSGGGAAPTTSGAPGATPGATP